MAAVWRSLVVVGLVRVFAGLRYVVVFTISVKTSVPFALFEYGTLRRSNPSSLFPPVFNLRVEIGVVPALGACEVRRVGAHVACHAIFEDERTLQDESSRRRQFPGVDAATLFD